MKIYKFIYILTALIWLIVSSCNAKCKHAQEKIFNPPDSVIVKTLGDTITDVIFNAKKVSVYKLAKVFDSTAVKLGDCEDFARDSFLTDLSPATYAVMDFILLSDTVNYKTDSMLVRTQYYPSLEFEFQKKKEIVKIRISIPDYSWSIIHNNKRRFNFNYKDQYAIQRFCNTFNIK